MARQSKHVSTPGLTPPSASTILLFLVVPEHPSTHVATVPPLDLCLASSRKLLTCTGCPSHSIHPGYSQREAFKHLNLYNLQFCPLSFCPFHCLHLSLHSLWNSNRTSHLSGLLLIFHCLCCFYCESSLSLFPCNLTVPLLIFWHIFTPAAALSLLLSRSYRHLSRFSSTCSLVSL